MDSIQAKLFEAQCTPIVGVIPAALKVVVSLVQIVAAATFLLILQTVGKPYLPERFVSHESDACVWHISVGFMSSILGIVGVASFGLAPQNR